MSTSFSANQYQNAFVPDRLQNWEVPMKHRENSWATRQHIKQLCEQMPRKPEGFTEVIANDKGHLMDGVPRSHGNPWGNFVGTWDLPQKIPGNRVRVETSRAVHAVDHLEQHNDAARHVLTGCSKNQFRSTQNQLPADYDQPQESHIMVSDVVAQSPARMNPDVASPVGLPSDRRSPSPAENLPKLEYGEEQVIAL